MTYVDQTEFSDKDKGTKGNCLSACLANLLSIDLTLIPNFAYLGDAWFPAFSSFLKENGYRFKGTYYFSSISDQASMGTWEDLLKINEGINGVYITAGPSPRLEGVGHAVLYKDGNLLHDPHPSREGILSLRYTYMIELNTEEK